jgi:hypothetical protein
MGKSLGPGSCDEEFEEISETVEAWLPLNNENPRETSTFYLSGSEERSSSKQRLTYFIEDICLACMVFGLVILMKYYGSWRKPAGC